jgi:hypothetical protein
MSSLWTVGGYVAASAASKHEQVSSGAVRQFIGMGLHDAVIAHPSPADLPSTAQYSDDAHVAQELDPVRVRTGSHATSPPRTRTLHPTQALGRMVQLHVNPSGAGAALRVRVSSASVDASEAGVSH